MYLAKKAQNPWHKELGWDKHILDHIAQERIGDYMDEDNILRLIFNDVEVDPENPNLLCHLIANLFTRNPSTQDKHAIMWGQVDYYFKEKLIDIIGLDMLQQKDDKLTEFSNELSEAELSRKLKNGNTRLNGLADDQIRVLQEIDKQYYEDIMNCTYSSPYVNDEIQKNWYNITYLLAFPNAVRHADIPFYLKLMIPQTYTDPFVRFKNWI